MNNLTLYRREDWPIPGDFPTLTSSQGKCYPWFLDLNPQVMYTHSQARINGETVTLLVLNGDDLFVDIDGIIYKWNYFTSHRQIVGYYPLTYEQQIWSDSYDDICDVIAQHDFIHFRWPAVIWNIVSQRLEAKQIVQGLKAQFSLTGIGVEHAYSVNHYRFFENDQSLTLQELCFMIHEVVTPTCETTESQSVGATDSELNPSEVQPFYTFAEDR